MTPWQNRVTALTQRMADDMRLRNYSQKTIDAYTYHVGRFAQFLDRSPESASAEDVRSFQLHLIEQRKVSWSSFNQAVCGLRFLFRTTYPRDLVDSGQKVSQYSGQSCSRQVVAEWNLGRCQRLVSSQARLLSGNPLFPAFIRWKPTNLNAQREKYFQ